MFAFISWLLGIAAALLAVPTATLCLEILAGVRRTQEKQAANVNSRRRVAVIVPARNEGNAIIPTLADLKTQLHAGDVLLVIADNCTDNTAEVARAHGADVIERHDTARIGKGYALDFGLAHLEKNSPEFVVMVDADCRVAAGSIDRLVAACAENGRPAQALYLMQAPKDASINQKIAAFAWRVKNWVRPLGLKACNLPCQLMGSGMAFPWPVIRAIDLASGSIVEDLKLGLDLTAAGHAPLFCPTALVTSEFASTARGADSQRRRWEQGHILTILNKALPLLWRAITGRNLGLAALVLDLAVPPLSLLVMFLVLMFVVTALAAILGLGSTPFIISTFCVVGFATTITLAWNWCGRDVLSAGDVASIPLYVLRKAGLYREVLTGQTTSHWVGTERRPLDE